MFFFVEYQGHLLVYFDPVLHIHIINAAEVKVNQVDNIRILLIRLHYFSIAVLRLWFFI